MRRYIEPQHGPDERLGVERGGDRPLLDVCLSEGDTGQFFLVAYLIVGSLDPVLLAAATDGGAIACSPHTPVPAEDLSLSERERFTKEVAAVGATLYSRVVINENIWEGEEA